MFKIPTTDSEKFAQRALLGMWEKVSQHSDKKIMHLSGPVLAAASGAILITARTAKVAENILRGLVNILASPVSWRRSNGESRLLTGVKQIAETPFALIGVACTVVKAIKDVFKITHGMARDPRVFARIKECKIQDQLCFLNFRLRA